MLLNVCKDLTYAIYLAASGTNGWSEPCQPGALVISTLRLSVCHVLSLDSRPVYEIVHYVFLLTHVASRETLKPIWLVATSYAICLVVQRTDYDHHTDDVVC